VEVKKPCDPGVQGREHGRFAVDHKGQVTDEALVEDGVHCLLVIASAIAQTAGASSPSRRIERAVGCPLGFG
jgi:hypothetical protein